jgi:hypothetical protein
MGNAYEQFDKQGIKPGGGVCHRHRLREFRPQALFETARALPTMSTVPVRINRIER